jgi:voltage-gated sodium channel
MTRVRQRCAKFIATRFFERLVTALILFNAAILGIQSNGGALEQSNAFLNRIDYIILICFVIELSLRLFVHGWRFFRSGWNVFDFLIVGISVLPQTGPLAILRTFRIFRVLRLISISPKMRSVVSAFLNAIPSMASVLAILLIVIYVAAVFATQVFGVSSDPLLQKRFGTLGASMLSLFQVMTLEQWVDLLDATMVEFPYAWIFFVVFLIITTFSVLNLFIGIIVDAMNVLANENTKGGNRHSPEAPAEQWDIRKELDDIKSTLKRLEQQISNR